ncbi:MAG: beta-lactamase family protein [Bacteroidales bacterium]|nr:beta-lactamase family protein [Bacteroidales bacterium]
MKKSIIRFSLIVLIITISVKSYSQKGINTQLFDDYFNKIENFNGNILVAVDGQPVFEKSYGFANLELDVKNSKDTKFCIGSLTKQFTSMAIFILFENGKLKLTDKISTYLDSLPETWQNITIYQLLTHTSGLIHSWTNDEFKKTMSLQKSLDEVVKFYYPFPLVAQPGEKLNYSGPGYFVLAKIIENISGKTYEEFLKEEIFNKAKMENTGAYNPSMIYKNMASGYQMKNNEIRNADFIYLPILTGGGNLYSTIEDLLKWSQIFNSETLISDSTKKIMQTPVFDDVACGIGYGKIKLEKSGSNDNNIPDSVIGLGHGGWVPGFSSGIDIFPEKKILIVKLSNGDYFMEMYDEKFTQLVLNEIYHSNK